MFMGILYCRQKILERRGPEPKYSSYVLMYVGYIKRESKVSKVKWRGKNPETVLNRYLVP